MNKILLENRLPQALPILIRDIENPKVLVQSHILNRGRKLILPTEMSQHISSLANKGYIRITYMEGVATPEKPVKATPPMRATEGSAKKSEKKKTTKKGRK